MGGDSVAIGTSVTSSVKSVNEILTLIAKPGYIIDKNNIIHFIPRDDLVIKIQV